MVMRRVVRHLCTSHLSYLSFYKYYPIADPHSLRNDLFSRWSSLGATGRIYVANEGINAQMCVPKQNLQDFLADLKASSLLSNVKPFVRDEAGHGKAPFKDLDVRVRPHVVADNLDVPVDVSDTGTGLSPHQWNAKMKGANAIVVDTRNKYESQVGHFKNAILLQVDAFRDAVAELDAIVRANREKEVMMYCTGGIRCEKLGAYVRQVVGHERVFRLEGGINAYSAEVGKGVVDSLFVGKNFVFDERLSDDDQRVSSDVLTNCVRCGVPSDSLRNCANTLCHWLFPLCQGCSEKMEHCCSEECVLVHSWTPAQRREFLAHSPSSPRGRHWRGRWEVAAGHSKLVYDID